MKRLTFARAVYIAAIGAIGAFAVWGCARNEPAPDARAESGHVPHDTHSPGSDHAHGDAAEAARGQHAGRLFASGDVQLELAIEEEDGPPMFVAWLYDAQGTTLDPEDAVLTVQLERLGNRVENIAFQPMAHHMRGDRVVGEPHSFAATIALMHDGKTHQFRFEQHEFRVELSKRAVERAGIVTGVAGPDHIDVSVSSPGEVRLNRERMLIVQPRFSGVVSEMRKRLGDSVRPGEVLTVIQSNNSLTEYDIVAPMAGNIVARSGMVGATVDPSSTLYTLADLTSVWVDFAIYPQHVGIIKRGQPVTVRAATQPDLVAKGEVSYVGPLLEQETRVSHGRIELPNRDGRWQPGLYVNVTAIVDHAEVAVSVPDDAIIRSKWGPAVFIASGTTFEVQPVTPGRTDGTRTEITSGLAVGDSIVVGNAYLLKAELGRAEATHDH